MRADSDQLGLTQRAVNKLREVRLTLFGAISFRDVEPSSKFVNRTARHFCLEARIAVAATLVYPDS